MKKVVDTSYFTQCVSVAACAVQLSFDKDANVGAAAVRKKAEENSS